MAGWCEDAAVGWRKGLRFSWDSVGQSPPASTAGPLCPEEL